MGRLQNQCLLILFTMAPRSQSHQIVSRSMSGEQIAVRLHFNHFYYVCCCRLYSMFVMVEGVKDELQAMRDGLISVIPPEILEGLTAEVHYFSPFLPPSFSLFMYYLLSLSLPFSAGDPLLSWLPPALNTGSSSLSLTYVNLC